jgi:hypothetical protein
MASFDLPNPLQDYFAFAETSPTRNGRRFCITLSYVRADGRLDRLQWWYHLSPAKQMALGDHAIENLRVEAAERFCTHIERWLHNTRQDMFGDGAIPYVAAEGNRVVAAFRVDPAVSAGVPAAEIEEELGDPPVIQPLVQESIDEQPQPESAEASEPSGQPHRAATKTAFG